MNIDKEKLKALAEAQPVQIWKRTRGRRPDMKGQPLMYGIEGPEGVSDWEDWGFTGKAAEYIAAVSPATVLALLAEIEQLQEHKQHLVDLRETHGFDCWAAALVEIDRLKAENEALRTGQAIKRLSGHEAREAFNGAYYQARDTGSDGEQCRAGVVAVIKAAMAKEAIHG